MRTGPVRRQLTRARRTATVVAVVALAVGLCAPVAPAEPGDGSVTLTFQSPWVGPTNDFVMRMRVQRPAGPSNLELATTIYPAVVTRSEFAETLRDRATAAALLPTQAFPLTSLTPDPAGEVTVTLQLRDDLSLGRDDGVFPVRVDLRERGTGRVLHRFTTHIVHVPTQTVRPKLGLSLVLPLHAPPGLPPAGARQLRDIDELVAAVGALDAVRDEPVALAPTPETLTTLAASTDERAEGLVKNLQQKTAGATVLAGSYVPTRLPDLLAAGLEKDATTQVALGLSAVSGVLRVRPDTRTWLASGPLDSASVTLLGNARGIDRLVADDVSFKPIARQNVTLTQPFQVRDGARQLQGVAADSGLAAHFDNRRGPALAANRLLADLAVVYLDQPGADRRAVAAVAPGSWRPDRQFLDMLLAGLAGNPLVEAVSLDSVFSSVAPVKGSDGRPLVRELATAPDTPGGLAEAAADLRTARSRLDSLGSVLGERTPAQSELEERHLVAQSDEWRTARQRQPYLEGVLKGIGAQAGEIRMPEGRSITLTDRKGEIPVTFQNRTGVPAKVVVRVESDKLDFPHGRVQTLDLTRLNTTERFAVVSRTSGAFPLRITLEAPDGNLELGEARLTVRSTVASKMSLIVSLGAALFLAVWWGRHALRGRRARRLVPA